MKKPICEATNPANVDDLGNTSGYFCRNPADLFYEIWLKGDPHGKHLYVARCKHHPREKHGDPRLFDGVQITREEYLVSQVHES